MGDPNDFKSYSGPYHKKIYVLEITYKTGRIETLQYLSKKRATKDYSKLLELPTVKEVKKL